MENTPYTDADIADLRASGHWPAEEETVAEETAKTGKRSASDTPA